VHATGLKIDEFESFVVFHSTLNFPLFLSLPLVFILLLWFF